MQSLSLSEILALVTVLVNLAGLVWGAAKMDAATKTLGKVTDSLNIIVSTHETRISRIEGRMDVQDHS
jgi:hypothetical protein